MYLLRFQVMSGGSTNQSACSEELLAVLRRSTKCTMPRSDEQAPVDLGTLWKDNATGAMLLKGRSWGVVGVDKRVGEPEPYPVAVTVTGRRCKGQGGDAIPCGGFSCQSVYPCARQMNTAQRLVCEVTDSFIMARAYGETAPCRGRRAEDRDRGQARFTVGPAHRRTVALQSVTPQDPTEEKVLTKDNRAGFSLTVFCASKNAEISSGQSKLSSGSQVLSALKKTVLRCQLVLSPSANIPQEGHLVSGEAVAVKDL
ncbi:hypothetical protein EYF80_001724 [Liparis tanakae]|uniref:Uncharacterized protein n=1 Tax=Liparis tanakae TaxID=230148 RepID=A0A4Z2JEE3_9TELE|nr:hypothetical protein EYF80_001724 [Liparis tanakae]